MCATNNADGRIEVFARGTDHALWHIWQTAPNNGWSDWHSLGGAILGLHAGRNQDGRIEVFATGMNLGILHIWQTAPNNGWSNWSSLGGRFSEFAENNNADGRLEVFARGSQTSLQADDQLWHRWQTSPNNGWSG